MSIEIDGSPICGEVAFSVLGQLEARIGGRVELGATKQRAVLAMLLLQANQVVSSDRLIDGLWGETPPGTAATALHGYVSQLRKRLEPTRAARESGELLATRPPGYVLRVEEGQLDLHHFQQLTERARLELVEGRPERASVALAEALALWRGSPLSDLSAQPFADAEIRRLEELRLAAQGGFPRRAPLSRSRPARARLSRRRLAKAGARARNPGAGSRARGS